MSGTMFLKPGWIYRVSYSIKKRMNSSFTRLRQTSEVILSSIKMEPNIRTLDDANYTVTLSESSGFATVRPRFSEVQTRIFCL
jgi:hypothetical protein